MGDLLEILLRDRDGVLEPEGSTAFESDGCELPEILSLLLEIDELQFPPHLLDLFEGELEITQGL